MESYLILGLLLLTGAAGVTCFLVGFAGHEILKNLSKTKDVAAAPNEENITDLIVRIAKKNGVDENLALRIAKCESGLNTKAVNTNKDGSRDRGLYQWNEKWHPEITDAMAFDPETATELFCKAVKEGHLGWWNSSRACWNK